MCVIITKEAGFRLPEQKIINACRTNKDGIGLVVYDSTSPDKPVKILRRAPTDNNKSINPDEVCRVLEKLDDYKLALHLRFKTAGDVATRNVHPFPVLHKKLGDDRNVWLMHNGTIPNYSGGRLNVNSDTRNFVLDFVRPALRMIDWSRYKLTDPTVRQVLEAPIPASNVVVILSEDGTILRLKENSRGGKWFDDGKWWASNDSYFEDYRGYNSWPNRPGSTWSNYYPARGYNVTDRDEWEGLYNDKVPSTPAVVVGAPPPAPPTRPPLPAVVSPAATTTSPTKKPEAFTDKYAVSAEDLFLLRDEDISNLVRVLPGDAIMLVKELLSLLCQTYGSDPEDYMPDENTDVSPYEVVTAN